MISSAGHLALNLLNLVPLIMQTIRTEMRCSRGGDLSVPQFRVLSYLRGKPGAALFEIADYLGLTSPSIVSLVDGLEAKGLVRRGEVSGDRRKVSLHLSESGESLYDTAFQAAQHSLAGRLGDFTPQELELLIQAMELLYPIFSDARPQPVQTDSTLQPMI
jgi:DNA-binding MarR family transcriptional regulator